MVRLRDESEAAADDVRNRLGRGINLRPARPNAEGVVAKS